MVNNIYLLAASLPDYGFLVRVFFSEPSKLCNERLSYTGSNKIKLQSTLSSQRGGKQREEYYFRERQRPVSSLFTKSCALFSLEQILFIFGCLFESMGTLLWWRDMPTQLHAQILSILLKYLLRLRKTKRAFATYQALAA